MDIESKIKEKEAELKQVSDQLNQLNQFGITLQGYLQALYDQRDAVKSEEQTDAE